MYAKRIQIINYGPIDQLDITFPFEDDVPKSVVLVGENGSGKSILLSHIVNGLISAKDITYPETPEVEIGKVFKIRSGSYIKSERESYFARVDFEDKLFIEEMRLVYPKQKDSGIPEGLPGLDAQNTWKRINLGQSDNFNSTFTLENKDKIKSIFSQNSVSIFPQIALKIRHG